MSLHQTRHDFFFDDSEESEEFYDFVTFHYDIETNIRDVSKIFFHEDFSSLFQEAKIIFLGETHHDLDHQKWNGKVVNVLWNFDAELLIEHEAGGSIGQLKEVRPLIAKNAIQWDFTESKTAAIFEKLVELSSMIKSDFREIEFPSELTKASKVLLREGASLIDHFLIHPSSVEEAWSILDHQMARILDEADLEEPSHFRLELLFKQAFVRVFQLAAFETLDRFVTAVEEEVEERNGWMVKKINEALKLKRKSSVILIAGSEHFAKMLTNGNENPLFTYLKERDVPYVLLIPSDGEALNQKIDPFREVSEEETANLETDALHLCSQLLEHRRDELIREDFEEAGEGDLFEKYMNEMEELKNLSVGLILESQVESHEEAMHSSYMVGAVANRIDKLAKIMQIWNVVAELSLTNSHWLADCAEVL